MSRACLPKAERAVLQRIAHYCDRKWTVYRSVLARGWVVEETRVLPNVHTARCVRTEAGKALLRSVGISLTPHKLTLEEHATVRALFPAQESAR